MIHMHKAVALVYLRAKNADRVEEETTYWHRRNQGVSHVKSVLTQKALNFFCETFYIPDEVHSQLPNPNQTIREMPTGKIGNDAICYTKPLDSLKSSNDRFFWVDAFACPGSFPWNTSKNVSKDPFPKPSEFNAEHYATLVAYPAPFHKYPEPFLCLVGISRHYTLDENTYPEFLRDNGEEIDLLSFIHIVDPTKVRVVERERAENEPRLLNTTIRRVVPLLPVGPARGESELEDSVDRLFDEGGSGDQAEQGDFASGGQGVGIQVVSKAAEIVAEDVRGEAIPTLPFVTSSVSATPEREGGDHIESMTGLNLQTISAPQRFVISSDSFHHSGANIAEAEVDSFARPSVPVITTATTVTLTATPITVGKEKTVKPSVFAANSSSPGRVDPNAGVFPDLTGSDFLVSCIRTIIDPEFNL
ncbi:hypothetical protein Tco_0976930 [Tanacetum coccineum]|uniref:Transposase (Putative), gypsy type n=1 Tax=Tanacetum coccineum TaxID=301880 RepID=A0ABQ5EIP7_9ASTR